MRHIRSRSSSRPFPSRRGMTLAELIMATGIMTIIAGGLAALAMTVDRGSARSSGRGAAVQHGQVVIERLERTLSAAHASPVFPGFAVFSEVTGKTTFPDTLVVWSPTDEPADPQGLPRVNEVIVYTPDPANPRRLLELSDPNDTRTVPPLTATDVWLQELAKFKVRSTTQRVQLTSLLRIARAADGNGSSVARACVRFDVRLSPSDTELAAYPSSKSWSELPWVQDVYGENYGLRQAWCRFELQLMPVKKSLSEDPAGQTSVPFFGSAALYYPWIKS